MKILWDHTDLKPGTRITNNKSTYVLIYVYFKDEPYALVRITGENCGELSQKDFMSEKEIIKTLNSGDYFPEKGC